MTTAFVPGHRLTPENIGGRTRTGIAICKCGHYSDVLPSLIDRQRWHRQHKAAVLAGKVWL